MHGTATFYIAPGGNRTGTGRGTARAGTGTRRAARQSDLLLKLKGQKMEDKLKHLPAEDRDLCVEIMEHTIGLDRGKVFTREGSKIYKPYRNYFNTSVGKDPWVWLEEAGYAAHGKEYQHEDGPASTDYYLTPNGIQWLVHELRINICITY